MSGTPTSFDGPQFTMSEAVTLAYTHWNSGQAQQAEQLCQRILDKRPQPPDALHLLGLMAHTFGRPDLAVRQACQALRVTEA